MMTCKFQTNKLYFVRDYSIVSIVNNRKNIRLIGKQFKYGIMTEELVIREIRIDKAAGRSDIDSRMMSFEVIMPLKLQSTKILIYSA